MAGETTVTSIRQVSEPCPKCGSYYRRGDVCNICGEVAPVKELSDRTYSLEGRQCRGRVWDKKLHRYLKPGEMR